MIKIKSWLCILMCLNVASLAPHEDSACSSYEDLPLTSEKYKRMAKKTQKLIEEKPELKELSKLYGSSGKLLSAIREILEGKSPQKLDHKQELLMQNLANDIKEMMGPDLRYFVLRDSEEIAEKVFDEAVTQPIEAAKQSIRIGLEEIAKKVFDEAVKTYAVSETSIPLIINACMIQMVYSTEDEDSFEIMKSIIEQHLPKEHIAQVRARLTSLYMLALHNTRKKMKEKARDFSRPSPVSMMGPILARNAMAIDATVASESKFREIGADLNSCLEDFMLDACYMYICIAGSVELTSLNDKLTQDIETRTVDLAEANKIIGVIIERLMNRKELRKEKEELVEYLKQIKKTRDMRDMHRERKETERGIRPLIQEIDIQYKLSEAEKEMKQLREAKEVAEKQMNDANQLSESKITGLRDQIANKGIEIKKLNEKMKQKEQELKEAKNAIKKEKEKANTHAREAESLDKEIAQLKQKLAEKDAEINELREKASVKKTGQVELSPLKKEIESLRLTNESLKKELDSIQERCALLDQKNNELIEEKKRKDANLNQKSPETDTKLEETRASKITRLERENKGLKEQLRQKEAGVVETDQLKQENKDLKEKLEISENLLREMLEGLSQQPQSTSSSSSSGAMPSNSAQ